MAQSIVIHGPQGCGKSMNAQRLRRHFGLQAVLEIDDDILAPVPHQDTLVLTNYEPLAQELNRRGFRLLSFKEAMRLAGFTRNPTESNP